MWGIAKTTGIVLLFLAILGTTKSAALEAYEVSGSHRNHELFLPCYEDRVVRIFKVPAEKKVWTRAVDIGYKFPGCFGQGEWVGYIGHPSQYVKLDQQKWEALLTAAGLTAPPMEPSRWQYLVQGFLFEVLGAIFLVISLVGQFLYMHHRRIEGQKPWVGENE